MPPKNVPPVASPGLRGRQDPSEVFVGPEEGHPPPTDGEEKEDGEADYALLRFYLYLLGTWYLLTVLFSFVSLQVDDHKTSKTFGAAQLFLWPEEFQWLLDW